MGKNSRVKKNNRKNIVITEKALRQAEREFSAKAKKEWLKETEERLRIIYAVAERNAFLKNMHVTLLTNRDVFGHGKARLERAVEHMIRQYECIDSDHVTLEDMIGCIKAETGVDVSFTAEEVDEMLNYGFEHGIDGVRDKFHELKAAKAV